ncbi:MAG: DUF615 domain-containing protein [Gammaproteobacteria bacterium]|nr:DUF615 domain-containing protein [Gammaproteobacteria bacterium]
MNSKPSKTARKREQIELQALGERLIGLTREQLGELDLDERLNDAVIAAQSIRAHGALRRQKQLIGKLMRNVDPEPIRAVVAALDSDDRVAKRLFRDAETWRDRLVADAGELQAFFSHTGRESPELAAALVSFRAAASEREQKAASRSLFREIRAEIGRMVQTGPSSS